MEVRLPFFRSCFIAPFFRRYGFYDVLRNPLPGLRFPDGRAGSRDKRGEREKEETLHPRNYGRFYYVSLLVRTRGIREVPIQFGNIFADLLPSPSPVSGRYNIYYFLSIKWYSIQFLVSTEASARSFDTNLVTESSLLGSCKNCFAPFLFLILDLFYNLRQRNLIK